MMHNSLMLDSGTARVSRQDLARVPTPYATPTWRPVPHHRVAELVVNEAESRGYCIVSEEYGLNPAGTKLFGVLRFHPQGRPEFSRALGLRNSHDKSLALGLTVGVSVTVCTNLAFGGETTVTHNLIILFDDKGVVKSHKITQTAGESKAGFGGQKDK